MRRILLILLMPIQMAFGQTQISLNDCYHWARDNYPNLKQAGLWQQITTLKKENNKTVFKPQVTLNGQATYQSDVPGIDVPIPNFNIPTVPKEQYKAYAELKQTIWDGGISAVNAKLEDAVLQSSLSQLEIEVYKLNEQVSQAFFTALVVEKQRNVLQAQKKVLEEKLKSIESGIKNGAVEKSAALVVKAEIINIEQNEIQLEAGKNAAIKMLSVLTGKEINGSTVLSFTTTEPKNTATINRPEQQFFASQAAQLDRQIELLDKSRNPKVFGFGQAGFGQPGLNLLNNKFDSFYLVGVGVSWNAFDWKNTFRKKQIVQLQKQTLQKQEDTFFQNIKLLLTQQNEQLVKLQNILTKDSEMVKLRTEIAKAAASKLTNQTISASDYIRELQAETVAKINVELHKIQLAEAREKNNFIKGNISK